MASSTKTCGRAQPSHNIQSRADALLFRNGAQFLPNVFNCLIVADGRLDLDRKAEIGRGEVTHRCEELERSHYLV